MTVAINIKCFTELENIICGPCPVHYPPKLQNKMHTTLNLTDQNNGCTPVMMAGRP